MLFRVDFMETFAKSGKKEVKMASNKFIWPIADLKHCTFGRLELCYSDSCKYEEKMSNSFK